MARTLSVFWVTLCIHASSAYLRLIIKGEQYRRFLGARYKGLRRADAMPRAVAVVRPQEDRLGALF